MASMYGHGASKILEDYYRMFTALFGEHAFRYGASALHRVDRTPRGTPIVEVGGTRMLVTEADTEDLLKLFFTTCTLARDDERRAAYGDELRRRGFEPPLTAAALTEQMERARNFPRTALERRRPQCGS